MAFNWLSFSRYTLLVCFIAATAAAFFTLPVEKMLKDFLVWVEKDLGRWGPLVFWVAVISLAYLWVFLLILLVLLLEQLWRFFLEEQFGEIARSFVFSKVKDYPQFLAVAIAVQKSGFKIVLLLRLVPILPFSMLNYLLSMTPTSIVEYILATWLGMMVLIVLTLLVSVVLIFWVTKVAKSALEKALIENEDINGISASHDFSSFIDDPVDLQQALVVKIDPSQGNHGYGNGYSKSILQLIY